MPHNLHSTAFGFSHQSKHDSTAQSNSSNVAAPVFAGEHEHGDAAVAQAFIKEIQSENAAYVGAHKTAFFQELAKG